MPQQNVQQDIPKAPSGLIPTPAAPVGFIPVTQVQQTPMTQPVAHGQSPLMQPMAPGMEYSIPDEPYVPAPIPAGLMGYSATELPAGLSDYQMEGSAFGSSFDVVPIGGGKHQEEEKDEGCGTGIMVCGGQFGLEDEQVRRYVPLPTFLRPACA
jgi:hypothetical protein